MRIRDLGPERDTALHGACAAADPKAVQRIAWTKSSPYLKLPVVSSPALSGSNMVFGDGMHQTDGALLHCLRSKGGLPLWQLTVPGSLVHLEGSPTIADGRVYIGGGAAGVICVDLDHVTLDGKKWKQQAEAEGYTIPRGRWVKIDQEVMLNEPDLENGVLRVWLDGALAIDKADIAYRVKPDIALAGIAADVFYNGEDVSGRAPADAKVMLSPFEIRWP